MSVRDLIERRKQGATGGAPSTPAPAQAPAKKPASSAVARLIEQKKSVPVVKPQPATPAKPLRETPYSFGASNELLGITPQLDRQKLAEAQYRGEQVQGAKDQLGIKRGFFKQYSHDVNELMASANRGIGDTVGMFGKALTFLGKANDDKGLWKYYSKTGEFLSRSNEGYAEVFKTADSEAINTILENDPMGAIAYKEFWVNKVPQTLVPSVALALPSMGVGGAIMGGAPTLGKVVLATTAGSMVSRPIESASEAGETYTTMLERGASEEEAMKSAQEVFAGNMKLVGVDAVQLALALTPFKAVLGSNPTFLSKLAYGTIATTLGSGSEGAEEVYQLYVQKKAMDDEFDMFGNEAQQSFILGVIGGLAFQGVGFAVSPREKREAEEDYVNKIIDKLPPDQQNQFTETQTQEEKVDMLEAIAKTNDYAVTDAVRAVDKEYLDNLDGTKKADQLEMLEPEVITAIQNGQSREEIALQLNNQGVAIQDALDLVDRLASATPQTTTAQEIDATLLEKTASQLKKEQDTAQTRRQSEITQIKTDIANLQKNITKTTDAVQKDSLKKDLAVKRDALKTAETALQEDTVRSATGLRALVEQQVRQAGVTDGRIVEEVITQVTSGRGSVPIREVIADAIRSSKATPVTQPAQKKTAETKGKTETTPAKETDESQKTTGTPEVRFSKELGVFVAGINKPNNKVEVLGTFSTEAEAIAYVKEKTGVELTEKDEKPAKTTQKDKVKDVVEKKGKASIKEIAEATGILEPNVRRILGMGAKDGEFKRVDNGVYTVNRNGQEIAVIIPADAVTTLPKLAKEGFKADMVFLDIPYDTPAVKGGNRGVKYDLVSVNQFDKVLKAVKKILRNPDSPVIHMYSQAKSGLAKMQKYNDLFPVNGFIPVGKGEYQKTFADGSPVTSPNGKVAQPEGILVFTKSGKTSKALDSLQFKMVRPKGYQTEKPALMLKKMIEMTTEQGDVVLDPFAGSGVTVDEAVKAGRKAVGIEVKEEQVKKIAERVEESAKNKRPDYLTPPDVVYHGTLADFDKFDASKRGENTGYDNASWGYFFIGEKERAEKFVEDTRPTGDNRPVKIKEAKIDLKNPLDLTLSGVVSDVTQANLIYRLMWGEDAPVLTDAEALQEIDDSMDLGTVGEFYDTIYTDESYLKAIKEAGYDGIVSEFGREDGQSVYEYVVFDADQITVLDKLPDTKQNKDNETSNDTGSDDNEGGTPEPISNESKRPRTPKDPVSRPNGKDRDKDNGADDSDTGVRSSDPIRERVTNEEIEAKVAELVSFDEGEAFLNIRAGEITDEVRDMVSQYQSGGKTKEGRGILDEYYTKGEIVNAIKGLLDFPARGLKVLEPSIGTGNFLYALPQIGSHNIDGYEINATTAGIAKILHPDATIYNKSFETEFIDERGNKKDFTERYDLVLGNPPYGEHRGEYLGLGEEPKIKKYEDYFVKRSIDLLKDGGTLAMVLPSSWADRKGNIIGVEIEKMFRLPNGVFEGTDVGTDIVILRKKSGAMSFPPSEYFKENPQNIMGEVKTRKGRFGEETYVDGTLEDALAQIDNAKNETEAIKILKELKMPVTEENVIEVAEVVEQAGKGAKAVVKAEKREKTEAEKKGEKTIETKVKKVSAVKGETKSINVADLTPEMETLWRRTQQDGSLSDLTDAEITQYSDSINSVVGKWYLDFNYAQGDIYEKLAFLESDYRDKKLDKTRYEAQKAKLNAVLPMPETVADMKLTPNMQFVKDFKMGMDANENEITMASDFRSWLQKLPQGAFGTSNLWEIQAYVQNEQVRGQDQKYNERVRERRKRMADSLFAKYLNEGLDADMQKEFENRYNQTFNFFHTPDYSQVPLFGKINSVFEGRPFEPNRAQRKGIGRLMNTGVGILAHEVGFGKTISGVLTAYEAMQRGWAKRPLIVVPNDNVASQWIDKTIMGLIPDAKVNFLGNLGANFKGDLSSLTIEEGSFTVVTYEGLKRLSFTDETYARMAEKFTYVADELGKDKTKRELEKEKAETASKRGSMKKGTRADLTFEGLGFDHFTFDEAHNANHVVGKVKLKKGEASEFNRFGLMPSALGIKTWLASQYIQEQNNGRNVTLLSATPFTNHPLEYYSILSMVADKSLEKMGFRNVNEFFSAFMEASNEFEFKADGSYDKKTDIRSFKNYRQFRKLLDSFIDFEQDSPDILRPNRIQKSYEIPKNDLVREMEAKAQAIFTENENESGKGAKILRAISELQLIAISPYLSQFSAYRPAYKEFVENSPKLDVVMQLIAQNKKDRPEAGQIIYSQKGVEIFPYLRDYLVKEVGFKPEEVAIIVGGSGSVSPKKRVEIQKDFNAGKIKVLIGSDTITEGMNLQINTTDMHLLSLPWNFTALRQVIGRAWRQQNTWKNVRINQYFMQDSVDVFMSQKLDNKQRRYENAIKSNANEVDVGDVSYNEFKFDLVKDPEARAKLELQSKKEDLNLAIQTEQSELAFATRRLEKVNAIDKDLKSSQEGLDREMAKKPEERNDYWVTRYGQEVVKYQKDLDEAIEFLKERGVSVDSLLATKKEGELKVESLQKELASLETTFAERVKELKENAIEPPMYTRDVAKQFADERAIENKEFYQKANQPKAEIVTVKRTPKARVEPVTVLNPEPEVKKTKKTVVTKKKTVRESKNKDARVMAILGKPDLTVAEKVTEILDTKQEGKAFKDVGERVSGSKKERATIRTVFENADADVIAEMIRTLGGEAVAQTLNKAEILEDAIVPNYEADQRAKIPAMIADWKMRVYNSIAKVPVLTTKRSKWRQSTNVDALDMPRFLTEYPELLRTFVEDLANVTDAISADEFDTKYNYFHNWDVSDESTLRGTGKVQLAVLGKAIEKIKREARTFSQKIEDIGHVKEVLRKGAYQDKDRLNSEYRWDSERSWVGLSYNGNKAFFENEQTAKESVEKYRDSAVDTLALMEKRYNTGYDMYQKKKTPALEGVDLSHGNFEEIKVYDRKGIVPAERINVETLTKELGFKSVQLGNYMDDSTAKQHIEQAITAVEDMSRALKVDFAKIFNQRGLSIAFGARGGGRANAHYEPSANIINLTKNRGDGSFGHELIHFFDYKYNRNAHRETWSSKKTRYYRSNPIEEATLELMDALTGRKIRKEVTLQPQDDSYVLNQPSNEIMQAYAQGKTFDEAVAIAKRMRYAESQTLQWVADVYRKPVTDTIVVWNEKTEYYKKSLEVGGGSATSYWVRPQELLARAGQSYLEDKLKEAGIKNSYVTRPTEGIKYYPQGEERKIFNQLFDKVFAVLAREYPLVSETEKVVDDNQNFIARFKGKSESQTVVGASYALPFLRDVKMRLQLDFNVRFVDTILASESAQKNKPPIEAWGAVMGNTVVLAREITRWTAQHETGHLIFNNLDRLKSFTRRGITKKALVEAKIAELRAKGVNKIGTTSIVGRVGVKETMAVEEQIMLDFEEYLENRYQPSAGIIKRFYLALKRMVMDFANMFKADTNVITDFYEMIDTGMAIDSEGATLETAGILDEYLKDRRDGVVSYQEAEMLMGGARFKLRQEPDKVLQKIQQQYNDTETALTQKQDELEKVAVEMDEAIEQSGRLAEVVEETPENVKELKRNTTRKPPVLLTEAGVAKVDEYGFANKEEAEQAITAYVKNKTELLETRNQLAKIRRQIATLKRGSKLDKSALRDIERKLKLRKSFLEKKSYYVEMGRGQGAKEQMRIIRKRGQVLNNLQDMIGLSDAKAKTLIGELTKQKMHLMSEKQFDDFLIHFTNRGTELANKLFEQQEVQAMIQEKQLQKVDNLRKALNLPPITKMKAEQASLFAKALSEYEFGDTFLSQRQLETIHRTDWAGAKTEREMFDTIFDDTGISKEDMKNVTVSGDFQKFKNWLVLSRSNPMFSWIVDKRFKAELETEAKLVAFEQELNPIVNKARASRTRSFVGKIAQAIAPMDELVFGYIEADNKEEYRVTNEMTNEEVELAHFLMGRLFMPAKDYMSSEYAMATRENYITHIRRGVGETFITAMQEGKSAPKAVVEAISEIFSQQKEDEIGFGILAGKTSEIVAFEKWFQFAMPRSGNLVPSKNVAKASLAYARAYYKKQAVDKFVPEAMILATIQEKVVGETKKGLAINPKVRQFINEFVNDTKGRKIDFVTEQGSKADNAIRFGVMFVAFKYLGFRPVLGLASFIGEFVTTMRATTTKEKWRGLKRSIELSRVKDVNEKYKYFTGRNPIMELFDPQYELPQRLVQSALVLFSLGSFFNSRFYIRAKMTEQEWQDGLMSDDRMVTITKEMSKWRKTPFYIKSLAGNTAVGSMFTQFTTWAVPIVTTTLSDTQQLYKEIQKSGLKDGMTSEHAQELGKTIATIGTLYFIAMAISSTLGDEDERDIWFYVARELNTMFGAFGVMFDVETRMSPPLIGQLIDLLTVFEQLLKMETYKRDGVGYSIGDLKAWNTLERLVTPSAITDIKNKISPPERENTKVDMISDAIQSGEFKPEEIAEKINPDEWNNTKGERSEEKQKAYQEQKVLELTMEYNLRKKYPESKVAEIILTVNNNEQRVAKMIELGEELGQDTVYNEFRQIYRDRGVCGNPKEEKVCPISDQLFKTYREAKKN